MGVTLRFRVQGEQSVPKAMTSLGKTGFVKEFLNDNPKGNTKAVNEAWAAAGMTGSIGATLVNKLRSEMGLSGNLRAKTKTKPKTTAKAKSPSKSSGPVVNPGKTMFTKEYLVDNPKANVAAVNAAWAAAGFEGVISPTVVAKLRASLGLAGNLRRTTKTASPALTTKKLEKPVKVAAAATNGQHRINRSTVLDDVESDIDRVLFKVMSLGDLGEIEDSLRQVRRSLFGALARS